jgi:hypothetical protein
VDEFIGNYADNPNLLPPAVVVSTLILGKLGQLTPDDAERLREESVLSTEPLSDLASEAITRVKPVGK